MHDEVNICILAHIVIILDVGGDLLPVCISRFQQMLKMALEIICPVANRQLSDLDLVLADFLITSLDEVFCVVQLHDIACEPFVVGKKLHGVTFIVFVA